MKKGLCLAISLIMIFLVFSGCASKGGSETGTTGNNTAGTAKAEETTKAVDEKSKYWISDTKITLKVMSDRQADGSDWKDLSIFKTLEEMTNIAFDFDITERTSFQEKKNLALATGELPDLFIANGHPLTPYDEITYGPQGYLVPLNDLIDQYAPNLKKRMEEYPWLKKAMTCSDGNIYALANVYTTATAGAYKPVINKTWLANLNMEMPQTIDELYNVLVAFRDKDPNQNGQNDEIPMSNRSFSYLHGMLLGAFGQLCHNLETRVYLKDGIVQYFPMSEGYKLYLQYLKKLFDEKLLDNMFLIQSAEEFTAKTKTNNVGVLGTRGQCDYTQYETLEPFTSEYNSEKWSSSSSMVYQTGRFAITKENKYPVESIKFADLFALNADEAVNGICGASLWLGQKGVDWDITPDNKIEYLFKPAEGMNETTHLVKYIAPSSTVSFGICILPLPFKGGVLEWVGDQNKKHIIPYEKNDMMYPSGLVRFEQKDSEREGILITDLKTYVDDWSARLVTGQTSFDKWDEYIDGLKRAGVEEHIRFLQDAYDKFVK